MFTIGQFSRITGLTVKTVRLYHEQELILPARVDPATGYRHFDQKNVEQARAIQCLREVAFPLADIKEILDRARDDSDLLSLLEKQRGVIEERARHLIQIAGRLTSSSAEVTPGSWTVSRIGTSRRPAPYGKPTSRDPA